MKLTPVLTEKSLNEAKKGRFTFWIDPKLTKAEISRIIKKVFDVEVVSVATMNYKRLTKRNFRGRTQVIPANKKAVVTLKAGQKISYFETEGKTKWNWLEF